MIARLNRAGVLQERVVGGFSNGSVLRVGAPGEGWEAGYAATLQTPGAAPVEEGFTWRNVLASYVHLHFGSNPELATALVDRCRQARPQHNINRPPDVHTRGIACLLRVAA